PEALLNLDDQIAAGQPTQGLCLELIRNCNLLGARHMERLATMVCRLDEPEFQEQRRGFVRELEMEFTNVVRELHRYRDSRARL
ncbi:MAG: hypothetical protein AAFS10_10810, partial [Myxococcota bacterium]